MEYWATEPAKKKSKKAATSRKSDPEGKGVYTHNAGPVGFARIEYNMVISPVFISYTFSLIYFFLFFCRLLRLVNLHPTQRLSGGHTLKRMGILGTIVQKNWSLKLRWKLLRSLTLTVMDHHKVHQQPQLLLAFC